MNGKYIFLAVIALSFLLYLNSSKLLMRKMPKYRDITRTIESLSKVELALGYERDSSSTAYKIFIYNLPSEYNEDVIPCHQKATCFDSTESGYGKLIHMKDGLAFRATWHGVLDLTFHRRLLLSRYITYDPAEADVFYIPFYATMMNKCTTHVSGAMNTPIWNSLYNNLTMWPYLEAGKPHFMTLGMPEHFTKFRSRPQWIVNILNIVLEVSQIKRRERPFEWYFNTLVAPYQANGHFTQPNGGRSFQEIMKMKRKVFIFLAGSKHGGGYGNSTSFRNKIIGQMPVSTKESFTSFYSENDAANDVVHYRTPVICNVLEDQSYKIMEWMQNSVFCLQPPGDTATRKSFFDGIVSGCIPVIFELHYYKGDKVIYPFDTIIDYSKFTITVPADKTFYDVLEPYRNNDNLIREMQQNLAKIAKYLQYNDITTPNVDTDAFEMILQQVGRHFRFVDKSKLI